MKDLSAERWHQIKALLDAVLDRVPGERTAYLNEACRDDPALRREVEALVEAGEEAPAFLEGQALAFAHPFLPGLLAAYEKGPDLYGLIGQVVGHYRILEKLGGGGMGVVYKALDTKLDRSVALKFLPPHLSMDEEAKARFIHEAKAASALDHVNIGYIHEIDETDDGQLFIAMAFYAGETLKKKITRGPLPIDEALDYAVQIAEGLGRAHEAGIIHRDIKPANVMVTEEGLVKIVDFGLAKMADVSLTQTGTTLGTVAYMSPEQAQGEAVDQRTDLWSLGVVLYELLTGERPFRGDYAEAIIYAIRHDEPEPITALRPEVPEDLARIVENLLRKDREARYASAEALLADLQAIKQGEAAEKQAVAPVASGSSSRNRVWIYGGGALVVLVLAAFIASQLFSGGSRSIDSIAVLPLANLSGDPKQEYFSDGMTDALIENLGQIEALRVISRTSVMPYKTDPKPLREVGRALDVAGVVEGTVKSSGDLIEVTVRLYDAATEERLWSGRFERKLENVLTLQREVALAIAREIEIKLKPQEQERLEEAKTVDPEVYELYLWGRNLSYKRTLESLSQAITYFEQAIAKDADFAPAHASLVVPYFMLGASGTLPLEEARSKARQAAEQALALNESLSDAHVAMGVILSMYDWDWSGAERVLKRAISLNPNNTEAIHEYGIYLIRTGKPEEGLNEMKRLLALDPLSPVARRSVAWAYFRNRQYDDAIEYSLRLLDFDPGYAHMHLGAAYLLKGRYEDAIAALEREEVASTGTGFLALGYLGNAYALSGKRDKALALIEQLEEQPNLATLVAEIYTGLGQHDEALDWLDRASSDEQSTDVLVHQLFDPILNPLRSEPRFQTLLEKMGLTE